MQSEASVLRLTGNVLNEAVAERGLRWRRVEGRELLKLQMQYAETWKGYCVIHRNEPLENQAVWVNEKNEVQACKLCGSMPDFAGDLNKATEAADSLGVFRCNFSVNRIATPAHDAWVQVRGGPSATGSGGNRAEALCRALLAAASCS